MAARKKTKRKTLEERMQLVAALELEKQLKSFWTRITQLNDALSRHESKIASLEARLFVADVPLDGTPYRVRYLDRDKVVAVINKVFESDDVSYKRLRDALLTEIDRLIHPSLKR